MEEYLSISKEGATITQIDDIGEVADGDLAEQYTMVTGTQGVGVLDVRVKLILQLTSLGSAQKAICYSLSIIARIN